MKCQSCDAILTDFEATRKSGATGEHIDLCGGCFSPISHLFDTTENWAAYDPDTDSIELGPIVFTDDDLLPDAPSSEALIGGPDEQD